MKSYQQTQLLSRTDFPAEYSYNTNEHDEFEDYQQAMKRGKYSRKRFLSGADYTCCVMKRRHPIRIHLIQLIRSRWFERLIILIILMNCIMLAMYDPLDKDCKTKRCKLIELLEYVVFPFFALEMILKMLALGVFGKKSYFSDKWNIFDFIIILMGIVDIAGLTKGGFLTIVRLGRILRPLRAINRVPNIRILVSLLMDTIPMLANVLILAFLVFSCFGIMGVQMFQGKLRNRCYPIKISNQSMNSSIYPKFYLPENKVDFVCRINSTTCGSVPKKYPFKYCKNLSVSNSLFKDKCIDENRFYRECRGDGPNPFYGSVSFDNIAMAFVFIYQVVTLEGWGDLMYLLQDAYSFWTWIYFVLLIIVGSFFLVNLALVVITMQFAETKHREERLIRKQRRLGSSQLSLYSDIRNIFYKIRHCSWFSRKNFQSVHHIHQHVHVHQEPFYCQQCKQSFSPDLNQSPAKPFNIPNIEISCFDDSTDSGNSIRTRSASFPGSFPSSYNPTITALSKGNSPKLDTSCNTSRVIETPQWLSPYRLKPQMETSPSTSSNYLSPCFGQPRCTSSIASSSNTISVHAESISAVKIDGSNLINSRTALSLTINSPAGDCIQTKAFVDTGISNAKNDPHVTTVAGTECNIDSSTKCDSSVSPSTDQSGGEICFDSMFDLRNCDKYYVSEEPSWFKQFRLSCRHVSESTKVTYFVMFIIVLNTVFMAMEHHQQPKKLTVVIESCNIVFTLIFLIEMVLKILGMGVKIYFSNGFNGFDCFIVVLSVAELMVNNGGGSFTIFRSLRLLRIFRLVIPMRHQITVMLRTTSSVMTFFALLFLFMFTFAILGMNLFGGKFKFKTRSGEEDNSRSNFDSFIMAMVTVFQILTQEDWNRVMYDGIRATSKWAALYFLSLMTIGYYVLLNLLVAILVEGFTTPMQKERMAERLLRLIRQNRKFASINRTISLPDVRKESLILDDEPTFKHSSQRASRRKTCGDINEDIKDKNTIKFMRKKSHQLIPCPIECVQQKPKKNDPILLSARTTKYDGKQQTVIEWKSVKDEPINNLNKRFHAELWCPSPHYLKKRYNWSLYIFSKQNRWRQVLIVATKSKYFDGVMLVIILYSCVLPGLETPDMKNQTLRRVIDTSSFVLSWVFFMELVMKVIASGFVIGKGAYLKNGWNVLDFILVVTSMIDVVVTLYYNNWGGGNGNHRELIKSLGVFRAMRAMRPLRMIRRAPGLKLVVQALLYSLKPIGNTVLIAAFFYIVFGILGVQLLRGKFYYCCSTDDIDHVNNKTDCKNTKNAYWVNYQYNFDNVLEALMTLFIVSTRDGWVDIMHRGVDAVGVDQQPKPKHAPWRMFYFVSFLLVGGFLVLNMIVGVVVENFQRCQELQENQNKGKEMLDRWKLVMKRSLNQYWETYPAWRKCIYKMCMHPYWNYGITICIFLNVIFMAMEHHQMSKAFEKVLEISNYLFTSIYILEAVGLITAFGFKRYFRDKWYVFDMVIVLVSILSIVLEAVSSKYLLINPSAVKAMRLLRVVRALKLLKAAKGLRFLLDHVAETIPQVTNLGLLFSLLFYVYSCLGMQLFGTLECTIQNPCTGLGKHANFKSLGTSMLTLFRIATGDNWSGILKDTLRTNCDNAPECKSNCCIASYVSPVFFVTFVLFAQFVLVNIVIAVLMKHLRMPGAPKKKDVKDNKSDDGGSSGDEKDAPNKRMENKEKTFFAKWQGKVRRRMTPQDISKGTDKPYARMKRSTDDLDNIQLKMYETRSPCKVYEPYDPTFGVATITRPSLLDTNAFKKNIVRKSSCPASMKYERRLRARRKSPYLEHLQNNDFQFLPSAYTRDSLSGDMLDGPKPERVVVSQLTVPVLQCIRPEDIRWVASRKHSNKERSVRDSLHHNMKKLSEESIYKSSDELDRPHSTNNDLKSVNCKIDIEDATEDDSLLAPLCVDTGETIPGEARSLIAPDNGGRNELDDRVPCCSTSTNEESEVNRIDTQKRIKEKRTDGNLDTVAPQTMKNEVRAGDNSDILPKNKSIDRSICRDNPDETLPVIIVHLVEDSGSDDSSKDGMSDKISQNSNEYSTGDDSTCDDTGRDDSNDGSCGYSTSSTNDESENESTSDDTLSHGLSSDSLVNDSVCSVRLSVAHKRKRKLGVSSSLNDFIVDIPCSNEKLSVRTSSMSVDSLNIASCGSSSSLNVDDSGFMDSSLASYVIISTNQNNDAIT